MAEPCLLGALWGDICGAPYEFAPERDPARVNLSHPKRHFTDDTVLTLAIAKALLEGRPYRDTLLELALAHPTAGYGGMFQRLWIEARRPEPYGSYGNGAAMRVSPVAWAYHTLDDVLREAEASAACSHSHPDAIASAQATALALFLARKGQDKEEIAEALEARFGYTFAQDLPTLRAHAHATGFDASWRAVPVALNVFLLTDDFEACLRQAIALGADADTQANIACAVAEAYYGAPPTLAAQVQTFLPASLRRILTAFWAKFGR